MQRHREVARGRFVCHIFTTSDFKQLAKERDIALPVGIIFILNFLDPECGYHDLKD
jgi:hypothetical protein